MRRRPRHQVAAGDARAVAVAALAGFDEHPSARLNELLDTSGLPARDANLAREIASGVVRRQRLLDHVLEGYAVRGLPGDPVSRATLRAGAYQLLFLDRVPAHAAVDRSVACAPRRTAGFVNAVLRKVAGAVQARAAMDETAELPLGPERCATLPRPLPAERVARSALIAGLPDFLVDRWSATHGPDRAEALAEASCAHPQIHLRAVRIDRDELARRLATDGVETEPANHPRMVRWTGGTAPMLSAAHREGLCIVQDPTSVAAAEAVDAQPGERVLDLCAAPGTKATLLAEAVGRDGVVHAFDPDRARRPRILDNAVRLGLPWLGVVDRPEREAPYDRVLVDVPCSNTGVLARRVEVRRRLRPDTFATLAADQVEILRRALRLVRPDGIVVYSTCSIEPEENLGVVDAALAAPGGFAVVDSVTTLPDPPRCDGGHHAILRRDAER